MCVCVCVKQRSGNREWVGCKEKGEIINVWQRLEAAATKKKVAEIIIFTTIENLMIDSKKQKMRILKMFIKKMSEEIFLYHHQWHHKHFSYFHFSTTQSSKRKGQKMRTRKNKKSKSFSLCLGRGRGLIKSLLKMKMTSHYFLDILLGSWLFFAVIFFFFKLLMSFFCGGGGLVLQLKPFCPKGGKRHKYTHSSRRDYSLCCGYYFLVSIK